MNPTHAKHYTKAQKTAIGALGIAAVFVSTRILQFPIPLGYAHLGNVVILLFASFFGPQTGAVSGGLGSALADLTSFPAWTLPTLIIKTVMGLIAGFLCAGPRTAGSGKRSLLGTGSVIRIAAGAILAVLEMVFGYFLAGSILYGSIETGATQLPGLLLEGAVAIVLFLPLRQVLVKAARQGHDPLGNSSRSHR